MNNKLFKKFIEFGIGNLIVLITGFISSPIITRLILPEEFGKFSMFNTLTSLFLFILMLGLDQSYIRFFYEEDEEVRGKLLVRVVKLSMIVNIILSLILVIFYKPLSKMIIGQCSILLIFVIIIHNTFNIINKFSVLVVRMQQKGKSYSFLQVLGRVSYILFIVATFKYFKQDYRTLVFAAVLSNVVVAVLAVIIERKQWFSFSNRGEIKTPMREMIKFGMPLILSMSITWILQSTDKFFVSAYNGYLELGIYSSAFTIVAIINSVQESFITFWVPVANEKYKESPENTEFFSKVNSIVSMLMLLIGVGIITFKDIIVILLGSKYRDAIFIFPVLALMPIMYTISETTVIGINFKKKTRYHIITSLIASVANIIGNMILVPVLGAKGAAISTGISYMIFFIVRTVISQRFYYVDYNLKRLYISVSTLVVLAVYSSFNSTNIKSILLSFISLTVILLLYKFVILDLINLLKKRKQEAI